MFTGIINGLGKLSALEKLGSETRLRFTPLFKIENIQLGESIAANGVCLTVESFDSSSYTAFASEETIQKSNLSNWKLGSSVNLERALALGDRLGGHLVSGHVDCTATVAQIKKVGLATIYNIVFAEEYATEIINKGSVALDGISLTVNSCGNNFLEVSIIPETQKTTNISMWNLGYKVNLETDMLGKYVKRILSAHLNHPQPNRTQLGTSASKHSENSKLSFDFLRENGF